MGQIVNRFANRKELQAVREQEIISIDCALITGLSKACGYVLLFLSEIPTAHVFQSRGILHFCHPMLRVFYSD